MLGLKTSQNGSPLKSPKKNNRMYWSRQKTVNKFSSWISHKKKLPDAMSEIPVRVASQGIRIAILAKSDKLEAPHPCEGCIPRIRMAILAESGELEMSHPCNCHTF